LAVIVSLAGIAVAAIGLLGVVAPGQLTLLIGSWRILTWLPVTAALRVGLGILFLAAASSCRVPDLVRAVGILEFAGATGLLVLGSERLRRFVAWWLSRPPLFIRCWCLTAIAFGILLAYSGA
jgi:hypothetical protein